MNDTQLIRLVLQHLYTLAQEGEPATIGRVAADLGLERQVVAQAVLALDRVGLADCARVRLTLMGLAVAVGTRGSEHISVAA